MKFPAAKLLATVVVSVSLLGASAAPAEACCFLNWLFGPCCGSPCGSPCGPTSYYGPVSSSGCSSGTCGTTAYYSPFSWGGWSSYSSSGAGCSPCGSGSCASGDCAVSPPANTQWQSKEKPRTFDESGTGANLGDEGELKRTRPESGLDGDKGQRNDGANLRFQNPRLRNGAEIERTRAEEPTGKFVPVTPRGGTKSPKLLPLPEDDEPAADRPPVINLDEKVASRPAPERKRIALKPIVANARLVRLPAYPKSDWTAVDSDTKVAKK
jgi:hypothetical protein